MEERERGRGSERWRDAGMMDGWRGGGREKGEGEKETAEARAGETRGGERRQPVKQNIPQSDQTGDSFCLTGAVSLSCGYPPGVRLPPLALAASMVVGPWCGRFCLCIVLVCCF